jgi:hypothetical protein
MNTRNISIPIHKNTKFITTETIVDVKKFYLLIIERMEMELLKKKLKFEKNQERKTGFTFPWVFLFTIQQFNYSIRIIRNKYVITIAIKKLDNSQVDMIYNELENIVDQAIDIENPFYKEK